MPKHPDANFVRIRPYPKVVFYYPSVALAGVFCIIALIFGFRFEENSWANFLFLMVFFLNTLIFSFDFSVMMSTVLGITIVLGSIILALLNWIPAISSFFAGIQPTMNNHFYYLFFCIFLLIYLVVWIKTRFNYFDIRHNELFHKTGFLSDTQRINAPNLSYKKEIYDVLEYVLLRAGRIKLYPLNHEPFVVETVIGIGRIDKRLGEILSKMKVTFDDPLQHQGHTHQPPQ